MPVSSIPWTTRLLRLGGHACGLLALLLLAGWTLGHVLTDRFYLTQFLWWIPTIILLPASVVLGLFWRILAPGGVAPGPTDFTSATKPRSVASRSQRLYLVACLLVVAYVLIEEWRLGNGLRVMKATRGVRLVAWNASWSPMKPSHDNLVALKPEVLFVANPHYTFDAARIRASMGETTFAARGGILTVFSTFPIRRYGFCELGISPEPNRPAYPPLSPDRIDTGEAMWLEVDIPALGGPIIMWCIDMPSDVWMDRRRAFLEARHAIDAFRGPVMRRLDSGLDQPEPAAQSPGFPAPDIIMGDCNTPRGSFSIELLHANMHYAFDDAGGGPAYTYPRQWPIIAIDHILLNPTLRASRYDILDLGGARHRAQFALLHPRSLHPRSK